jgi:hypothetical protein
MARPKKRVVNDDDEDDEQVFDDDEDEDEEDDNDDQHVHDMEGEEIEDEGFEVENREASDDEAVPELKDDRIWTPCRHCGAYSLSRVCGNPCPPAPEALKILPIKTELHLRLFEAVCCRGGFASLSKDEFTLIVKDLNLNYKAAKHLYESSLWNVERQQTTLLIKAALRMIPAKATNGKILRQTAPTNAGQPPCGKCEGCLRDKCGKCSSCEAMVNSGIETGPSVSSCANRSCSRLSDTLDESNTLEPWQRGLLMQSLWGVRFPAHLAQMAPEICCICEANIANLSLKVLCVSCGLLRACEQCVPQPREAWSCAGCEQEDRPCWNGISACTGCGQAFTQTRSSQCCVECLAPFCSACAGSDLVKDPEETGSGSRCFFCRTWPEARASHAVPQDPGRSKRLKLLVERQS